MAVPVATESESKSIEALFEAAKSAARKAYADYSGFRVGAAILARSGSIYAGCNIENVAYPLGTCAEAAALAAARVAEGKNLEPVAIAIYAETNKDGHVPCTPCGGCRQRILEFGPDISVWFYGPHLKKLNMTAADLLPHAFKF
jgi:cytidine deaminase